MRIPIIPDWCKGLPDSTILYSADVVDIFGYTPKVMSNVTSYIRRDLIPEPSGIRPSIKGRRRATKHVWLLGDIRKLRQEMLKNKDNDNG